MNTIEIKLQIPENLDIDGLFEGHKEHLKMQHIKKPQMLYILDALVKSRALYRKKMNEQKTIFAPLWSTALDNVVHNYNKYLAFLVAEGILITDWHFLIGKKCRGYAFAEPYDECELREYTESNPMLLKAIDRQKESYDEETAQNMKGYQYLKEAWNSGKLAIDVDKALVWIEEDKKHKLSKLQTRKHWIRTIKKTKKAISTAIDFKNVVKHIDEKSYNYRIHGDGRRFYSNISNLKKGLRQFLSYDGKPLMEVDIKNSQPYLVIALFEKSFWEKGEENEKTELLRLRDISSKLYNKVVSNNVRYCKIITLLKSLDDQPKADLVKFKNLVLSGQLYEYIKEIFEPIHGERFSERPLVKKEVLRIFYSETELHETDPFYAPCLTFKNIFPTVYELFTLIKEGKDQHSLLPLILQRIESFVVLELVCKKLSELHPGIALFTIHDSILVTEEYKTIVEDMMRSELKQWIGHPPRLGTEIKQIIDTCTGEEFDSEKEAAISYDLLLETVIRYLNSDENPTCLRYLKAA